MTVLILMNVFESVIVATVLLRLKKGGFIINDDYEAVTDDYYDEIHANFLLNEYLRTKIERKKYQELLLQIINESLVRKSQESNSIKFKFSS